MVRPSAQRCSNAPARVGLLGPTFPFRGGIVHHTACLLAALRRDGPAGMVGFARLFPDALYPGGPPHDPSHLGPRVSAPRLLRPLVPSSWWSTARALTARAPGAIVLQYWHPYFAPATLGVLRALKVRLPSAQRLVLCHNALPHDRFPLERELAKAVLAEADGVLAHGAAGCAEVARLAPEQVTVPIAHPRYTPLATSPALPRAQARAALHLDDRPLLLFFGHVRAYKGLDSLLHALARLPANERPRLLVAGAWLTPRSPIDHIIKTLGLSRDVEIRAGYVANEALNAFFSAADAVVLPYRSATQSGVVQLAFAHHRPAIVSHVGSLAEAVDHEQTGLVVPAGDDGALAAAIRRFFHDALGPAMERTLATRASEDGWRVLASRIRALATSTPQPDRR